jgi:hypothetical protein
MSKKNNKYIRLLPGDIITRRDTRATASGKLKYLPGKVQDIVNTVEITPPWESEDEVIYRMSSGVTGNFYQLQPTLVCSGSLRRELKRRNFMSEYRYGRLIPLPGDEIVIHHPIGDSVETLYELMGKSGQPLYTTIESSGCYSETDMDLETLWKGRFALSLLPPKKPRKRGLKRDFKKRIMRMCQVDEYCVYSGLGCFDCPYEKIND